MGSVLLIIFAGKHINLPTVTKTKQALTISLTHGPEPDALNL